jgi:hypothetical protein
VTIRGMREQEALFGGQLTLLGLLSGLPGLLSRVLGKLPGLIGRVSGLVGCLPRFGLVALGPFGRGRVCAGLLDVCQGLLGGTLGIAGRALGVAGGAPRLLGLAPRLLQVLFEGGRACLGVMPGALDVGERDGERGCSRRFGGRTGGVLPRRVDRRLVLTRQLVLPARDGLVALAFELGPEIGEHRVPIVFELGPEGSHLLLALALEFGSKTGHRRLAVALVLGPEIGEGGVAFTGELFAQGCLVRPVALDLFAEGDERRLVVGGGRVERRLHGLLAVLGRDRHHIGQQAVQRLLDRAANFLDNRLGQALNAFVERHKQTRFGLGKHTETLFERIGRSQAELQPGAKPFPLILIL